MHPDGDARTQEQAKYHHRRPLAALGMDIVLQVYEKAPLSGTRSLTVSTPVHEHEEEMPNGHKYRIYTYFKADQQGNEPQKKPLFPAAATMYWAITGETPWTAVSSDRYRPAISAAGSFIAFGGGHPAGSSWISGINKICKIE